ncbi:MAG: ATP-dependent helicase [Lachnospiraceae bacterium]|nr:ATP-dependent helicase [Lachnospiraceae bacterium]
MKKQFNEAQRQAIAHYTGPCLTLAGPGSGKTTVIVERICSLIKRGVPAGNILVLTFTRAAAVEMRERFVKRMESERGTAGWRPGDARQVLFGTFHSACFQILRYSGGYDGGSVLRAAEKTAILEEVSRETGICHDREGWYQEVLKEIGDVKGDGTEPECYAPLSCTREEFMVLYRGYEAIRKKRRRLDFDDMLSGCMHLFEERQDILSVWQERCRFILVDEYQDSSRTQCRLAELLAAPENNIMVVGDDDQSIYGFRGAAPERMKDFLRVYPDAAQYLLNVNYRCHPDIVAAAGRLVRVNENRLPKEIRAAKAEERGIPVRDREYKEGPAAGGAVTCNEYETLSQENEAVIARIQAYYQEGMPYEDMAVLYRTNRNPAQLIRLMESRGIPVQVKGDARGLYGHWICHDFCAYLSAACGGTRRADWLRVVSHPERYFSRSALGQEPVSLDNLFDFYAEDQRRLDILDRLSYDLTLLKRVPPYAGISHLRRYMGYDDYLSDNDKTGEGRLTEIAEQLQETADGCKNAEEWLRYVAGMRDRKEGLEAGEADPQRPASGVRFMTMHGSKGLEFPAVFLTDANEGMTPYKRADSPEGIEEERRLFYVAMTRAKKHLHISWTRERFHRPQSVSRFVKEAMGEGAGGVPPCAGK